MPTTTAQQEHYQRNRVRYIAQAAERRAKLLAMVREVKGAPCVDCGGSFHFSAMDFDHVRGKKVQNISHLVIRGNLPLLLAELKKCEIVCANCHRIRTWNRRNASEVLTDTC